MTEDDWLFGTDPEAMLKFLRKAGDRKLRLFAVACCRSIWQLLPNDIARSVVLVAERFADGLVNEDELLAIEGEFSFSDIDPNYSHDTYSAAVAHGAIEQLARESDATFARRTGYVVPEQGYQAASGALHGAIHAIPHPPRLLQQSKLSILMRDIFGNPFRPISINPTWLTPIMSNLATVAYEDRALPSGELDTARLAVLADALEEAGCDNHDILGHLRIPNPHVRGCFAVDLILGKE